MCTSFAFRCNDGTKTVSDVHVCRGFAYCSDCSDQRNCSKFADMATCNTGPNSLIKCVFAEELCDGEVQCDNCFDERNCHDSKRFFCEDGYGCVNFNLNNNVESVATRSFKFCDGDIHCIDGSDEKSIGFGFKCASGGDGSGCIVPQQYLEKYLNNTKVKLCDNNAHQCFQVVNGIKIFDNSKCWSCLEGTIIQRQQVCNGIFDCPDLSDECLCKRDGTENLCQGIFRNPNCSLNEVSCPADGRCLNVTQICDGTPHCFDGFDEKHCLRECKLNATFKCKT